jgi:hypothetical protein
VPDEKKVLRSIAAELALLSLKDLEPRVADDPELLVSTESVLSFAAIRYSDPAQWEHWHAILEKHGKLALIEHILYEPARGDDSTWKSNTDILIRLAWNAGLELFHDPAHAGSQPAAASAADSSTAITKKPSLTPPVRWC